MKLFVIISTEYKHNHDPGGWQNFDCYPMVFTDTPTDAMIQYCEHHSNESAPCLLDQEMDGYNRMKYLFETTYYISAWRSYTTRRYVVYEWVITPGYIHG